MATGSSDRNDEEGTGDNSILQPLNWPEENTEAIGGTALLEMENEAGDLFESYAASMGGRSEDEKLAAEESNEGELRSSIYIEPKPATEDGDLFQSYPATILEGMEQIGDNEEEGKALAEGVLWLVGDRCVARWEEEQGGDGLWYRAQVDAVTGDAAEVTFVEYGNSATCALGQLQPWDALIDEGGQLV